MRSAKNDDSDDDLGATYRGSELSTYDPMSPGKPALSTKERNSVKTAGRRHPEDDEEPETKPLGTMEKLATVGKPLEPTRSKKLGRGQQALCASINAAGNTIALGCKDGKILVVDSHTLETMDTININEGSQPRPGSFGVPVVTACTAVRYLPSGGANSNVVIAAQGHRVLHVHVSTGKVLSSLSEGDNKVYNVQVRQDSQAFATCGSDRAVRLYDERTQQLLASMDHGDGTTTTGHSNDVFGLAWHPEDHNVLVSAGWDRTIQVWDVRLRRSVRSMYGPYVCGDALDIKGNTILAGSWRHSHPLELWDLSTCKLLTRLPFHQPEQDACKLYAAKFGKGQLEGKIVAGGSGSRPCVKFFTQTGELIGTSPAPSGVYGLDCIGLPQDCFVSVCCSDELQILDMTSKE